MLFNKCKFISFKKLVQSRITVVLIGFFFLFILYNYNFPLNNAEYSKIDDTDVKSENRHDKIVNEFFDKREKWNTSILGSMLFKRTYPDRRERDKTFRILIWKHWHWLKRRHIYYYGDVEHDLLEECSVKNCIITGDDRLLHIADAVIVHLQKGLLPKGPRRNLKQRWIFLSDETPVYTFSLTKNPTKLSEFVDLFNLSMTYSVKADVPVPYGRIIPLLKSKYEDVNSWNIHTLVPNWEFKRFDTLVAVLMSHCLPKRLAYIMELKKYVAIDIYGKCSDGNLTKSCPGYLATDCKHLNKYIFYLAFENSFCEDYMTEKLFYHAYTKGAIPIIRGPSLQNCEMLPPKSFLHVDNYETPKQLAEDIIRISNDMDELISYHAWRNDFEVVNEHGYFGTKSYHLCRLCEAMNYNDENESIYDVNRLKPFLVPNETCVTTT